MRFALPLQDSKRYANADILRENARNWLYRRRRRRTNLPHRRETLSQWRETMRANACLAKASLEADQHSCASFRLMRETVSQHLGRFDRHLPGFRTAVHELKSPLCPTRAGRRWWHEPCCSVVQLVQRAFLSGWLEVPEARALQNWMAE